MSSFNYQTNNLFFIPPELLSCPFDSKLFIMNKMQGNEVDGPVIIYSLPGKKYRLDCLGIEANIEGGRRGGIRKYIQV